VTGAVFMSYLSNFLALPLYPLGFAVACIAAGVIALLLRKRGAGLALVILSGAVLYAFSTDPLSYRLIRSLEKRYPPLPKVEPAPCIVLLTGGEVPRMPPRLYDEINAAGDRILYTARLFKEGVAPRIVITGGNLDFIRTTTGSQAEAAARLLRGLFDIDSSRILLETKARNTYENGLLTGKLLDSLHLPRTIILVTSAVHMPRAVMVFKKLGFTVEPAPTNFIADAPRTMKLIDRIPSASTLLYSTYALHEWYGMAAYRLLGRL
jgi:uncharacterized SAM-binding protein YcdF (DUF218 family)